MRASRVSKYTGDTFVTRKDRRIHDQKFLAKRPRERRINLHTGKKTRRAKAVRGAWPRTWREV